MYFATTTNSVRKLSRSIGLKVRFMATSALLPTPTALDHMAPKTPKAVKKENELANLPKPQKKVVAKVLNKAGFSSRTLEDWFNADHATICRWALEETPEELRQNETDLLKQIGMEKKQGVAVGVKRILELLPRERKLDQVVKTMEYLEGKQSQTIIQQNMKIEFVEDDART